MLFDDIIFALDISAANFIVVKLGLVYTSATAAFIRVSILIFKLVFFLFKKQQHIKIKLKHDDAFQMTITMSLNHQAYCKGYKSHNPPL